MKTVLVFATLAVFIVQGESTNFKMASVAAKLRHMTQELRTMLPYDPGFADRERYTLWDMIMSIELVSNSISQLVYWIGNDDSLMECASSIISEQEDLVENAKSVFEQVLSLTEMLLFRDWALEKCSDGENGEDGPKIDTCITVIDNVVGLVISEILDEIKEEMNYFEELCEEIDIICHLT